MSFPLDALNGALDRLGRHAFYEGRLPPSVSDAAEFAANVPLMGRADLVAEMQKPAYGAFGGTQPVRMNFSPMGGGLVPVMQTRRDLDRLIGAARTHLDACGVEPGDVCAVFFGYHLFVAGLFYQSQMEAHGVACIPLGPGEADRAVEICNAHNVNILAGNPSFSLRLMEAGVKPPKVFFAGGEAFTGNPTLYNAVADAMPGTMLVDSFSLSEFLPVGRTFPGGQGVHVFDELVYAEIIDPETLATVADGERGELVLTHLHKEAQPLVRYRTGDLTVKIETPSVFGRTVCLPAVVFGRTDEMVKVKGVKLYPSELRSVLLGIDGLDGGYRMTVSKKSNGGDAIRLTLSGVGGDDVLERIAGRFKSQTLVTADEIEIMETLEDGPAVIDEREN
ncbi:MAG: hypothetical protein HN478_17370 [Rhodospirillaceae bacterium]|jgi:phenylacetate-CoA ligase|nr:hypothetical protein [Rhodospirillaceae bacterium]MBT5051561.1 hypothetical protein [Rhodospirillaceae bacterium]MBT5456403.1 hypothetical protein [Rhodospirillaceae bacterium]